MIPAYGALAAILVVLGIAAYFARPASPDASDAVSRREIIEYAAEPSREGGEGTVLYSYKGEPLPEKLAPDEDIEKRTENSYTRDLGPVTTSRDSRARKYQTVFYPQRTYVKDGGTWYYREIATTTESAFSRARRENPLASLLWTKVLAASISPFSAAGDGYISDSESGDIENPATFSICNSGIGLSGPAAVNSIATLQVVSQRSGTVACQVDRAFIPFDTSAMPGNAVVSAATLSIYVTGKANGVNDGNDLIDLVQTSQASSATLSASDFTSYTSTTGATSLDITSITTSAYNVFTLDSTGLGWIKGSGKAANCGTTSGVTCLGLIEHHQVTGSISNNVNGDWISLSANEQTGTSQDPYLTVTYTASSFAFWQFQDY